MRIAYISELQYKGKIHKEEINLHTDCSWQKVYDFFHFPFSQNLLIEDYKEIDDNFDFVIINYPKEHNGLMNTLIPILYQKLKKVKKGFVQHGSYDYFMSWSTSIQNNYIQLIKNSDFFIYTNKEDYNMFKLLAPNTKMIYMPTTLESNIIEKLDTKTKEEKVMIGGNLTMWYAGTYSLLIADKVNLPITMLSMGRSQKDEKEYAQFLVKNKITFLPFLQWSRWFEELSKHRYAIHMMPIAAAGSFSVACASLGIPCIGREHVTAQKICFPRLCVNERFENIDEKVNLMINNYEEISEYAKKAFMENFESEVARKIFYEQLEKI